MHSVMELVPINSEVKKKTVKRKLPIRSRSRSIRLEALSVEHLLIICGS